MTINLNNPSIFPIIENLENNDQLDPGEEPNSEKSFPSSAADHYTISKTQGYRDTKEEYDLEKCETMFTECKKAKPIVNAIKKNVQGDIFAKMDYFDLDALTNSSKELT